MLDGMFDRMFDRMFEGACLYSSWPLCLISRQYVTGIHCAESRCACRISTMRTDMRGHVCRRAPATRHKPLESSRRGGHFEYWHTCTRGVGLPSAMPIQSSTLPPQFNTSESRRACRMPMHTYARTCLSTCLCICPSTGRRATCVYVAQPQDEGRHSPAF